MIRIPDLGDEFHSMWLELIELHKRAPAPWALVGAQMVALHGWALERQQIRQSNDADVLVNVRAVSRAVNRFSSTLNQLGFDFDGESPEGIGHRFRKGTTIVDLLGPEGLGQRAELRTVGAARTVQTPGGSQALRRSTDWEVQSRSAKGAVPLPNLIGAILIKARAVEVHSRPAAQRADLAFLLTLVEQPDALAAEMSPSEKGWLRRHPYLADPTDSAYGNSANAEDAVIAYRRLIR